MTIDDDATGGAPRLPEFVFQILCARARRNFEALDRPSLRGILTRNGLRLKDLLAMADGPVNLLNNDEGEAEDFAAVSRLFSEAVMARAGREDGQAEGFVERVAVVIEGLHRMTPFRFDPGEERNNVISRIMVEAGLKKGKEETLAHLGAALPYLPRRDVEWPQALRPLRPDAAPLECVGQLKSSPVPNTDGKLKVSIAAVLDLALPALPAFEWGDEVSLEGPSRPPHQIEGVHEHSVEPAQDASALLNRSSLDHRGRDQDRLVKVPGYIIGVGGAVVGTWLTVSGIFEKNIFLAFAGGGFVALGICIDFGIEILRVSRRASVLRRSSLGPFKGDRVQK